MDNTNYSARWNTEYEQRGIPSSNRTDPSGVVKWALANWQVLTGDSRPRTAIDIGCGTGRNAVYLAEMGIAVLAFDSSDVALKMAAEKTASRTFQNRPQFLLHDLSGGIPAADKAFDLALDIFVYKHQISPVVRAKHRKELSRVLHPEGRLLLSLAGLQDGYYSSCPDVEKGANDSVRVIMDPIVSIPSVLFDLQSLCEEMSTDFDFEMCWEKREGGMMHGEWFKRQTIATLWKPRGNSK